MTKIEWCDEVWNPIVGCKPVSPGCGYCYAARQASRGLHEDHAQVASRGLWNGTAVINRVTGPLQWRKPKRIFVGSMTDLFWDEIPGPWIVNVLAEIESAKQHTFMLLTKRPQRMRKFFEDIEPPRNLWLGVSVEDQATADERIPLLLQTPAALRFVSVEPMLGPVDLTRLEYWWTRHTRHNLNALRGYKLKDMPPLDWVIVGGESGPKARPCDVGWVRSVVGQCRKSSVPCFVKQLGHYPQEIAYTAATDREAATWWGDGWTRIHDADGEHWRRYLRLKSRKGADPSEWPEDLRVREIPA